MIWSIVSKDEMDNYGTCNVFKFYREALGRESIKLVVVDETDSLDFVSEDDIVLLRTASKLLVDTIWKSHTNLTHPGKYFRPSKVKIMRPTSPK